MHTPPTILVRMGIVTHIRLTHMTMTHHSNLSPLFSNLTVQLSGWIPDPHKISGNHESGKMRCLFDFGRDAGYTQPYQYRCVCSVSSWYIQQASAQSHLPMFRLQPAVPFIETSFAQGCVTPLAIIRRAWAFGMHVPAILTVWLARPVCVRVCGVWCVWCVCAVVTYLYFREVAMEASCGLLQKNRSFGGVSRAAGDNRSGLTDAAFVREQNGSLSSKRAFATDSMKVFCVMSVSFSQLYTAQPLSWMVYVCGV